MLWLQDNFMGHSAGSSFKLGTSQLPSLQTLKSCHKRINLLQVMACGECSASFFNAVEAFWIVSISTAQSPSSQAHWQCWLNFVFSESRLEVLMFVGFQMSDWQLDSQSGIDRRPQATQKRFWCQFPSADKYRPTKTNINLPSRLSINKQSCWYTNTRYQRAPDTFMLFFITLQHLPSQKFYKSSEFLTQILKCTDLPRYTV